MQTASDSQKQTLQAGKAELAGIMSRMDELDILLQKLYEDYALGRLPEKRHAKLSGQYEAEQEQLEADGIQEDSEKVSSFMELVNRYTDFTELTTPMLNEFIDKIVVHERERIDRYQYDQKVDIYFNFIGKIELPEDEADEAPAAASPEIPVEAGRGHPCAPLCKGGGAYREEAMRVGFQIRFLLVSVPRQAAIECYLQRRI